MTTNKDVAPAYEDVARHRQGFDLDRSFVLNRIPVRIRVHHDTSYWFQSFARAEVRSAATLSWNEAATVLPAAWAEFTTPVPPATEGLWQAAAELEARVAALLDG